MVGFLAPLDHSDYYRTSLFIEVIPWRGLVVGSALSFLAFRFLPAVTTSDWLIAISSGALAAAPPFLHWVNTLDYLTPTRLVQQRGILGMKRSVLLLPDVDRVEYSFPRFGQGADIGDVHVSSLKVPMNFRGIMHPAQVAQAILDAKLAMLSARDLNREAQPLPVAVGAAPATPTQGSRST
ncbi:MAG: hypothetical protein HY825_14605 [Acidobacteria bacterium]|nr:hypothetical protein [Acidobacteriota bacterium]